jgi:hypothetical protein
VHQEIKVVRVTLKAPYRPDRVLPDTEVTAILATEPHPPAQWHSLTQHNPKLSRMP